MDKMINESEPTVADSRALTEDELDTITGGQVVCGCLDAGVIKSLITMYGVVNNVRGQFGLGALT